MVPSPDSKGETMHLHAEALTLVAAEPEDSARGAGRLLAEILESAFARGASAVHLEPRGDELAVRMRVASALVDGFDLGVAQARDLAASLRSGPLRFRGREIGVATLSTASGDRIVLHLGAADAHAGELTALGMRPALVNALSTILARASGLVLVAGPKRAGISTTLSALLRRADTGSRSLLTLREGPAVAADLRAALAQDSDAILVPAIADRETAATAAQAAQAGHLVLAGVPVADSVGAILRLRELRVEPFQLASTLQAVVAQRLVRRLCGACRQPVQAARSTSALLGFDAGAVVYAPVGCERCDGTGFRGETAVFEAILTDAPLRRLIDDGGDGAILARHAFLNAPNLGSAARALVREGVTTPEEALRVSRG